MQIVSGRWLTFAGFDGTDSAMKTPHLAINATFVAVLLASFGPTLLASSVDLVSHYSVVNELMTYGRIRPQDTYLGTMHYYPDLTHWVAAVLGWLTGSGLVAIWLVAIAAIYATYYAIARTLSADGSWPALPAFGLVFAGLYGTRALAGWEIVDNFFYPQIVAFAGYFLVLMWLSLKHRQPIEIAGVGLVVTPILYLMQPLAGIHFTAAMGLYLLIDGVSQYVQRRHLSLWHVTALVGLGLVALISLLFPSVRKLMSHASNDGALTFLFPFGKYLIPFAACALVAAINLALSFRVRLGSTVDRVVGAAGVAAGLLVVLQYVALVGLHQGSPYAVKKHGFVLVTLGAINLARLIARAAPRWTRLAWQPYAAALVAFVATAAVCWRPGMDLAEIVAAQRSAAQFAATSPEFKTGNTSAYIASFNPTVNMLLSVTAFHVHLDASYVSRGKINPDSAYVMTDRAPNLDDCAVWTTERFAVVPASCIR
jgi:hypothetical protein